MGATWQLGKEAPVIKFMEKLSSVYTKMLQLHALRQTYTAIEQIKSMAPEGDVSGSGMGERKRLG
jgi:hypothetical protein